MREYKHILCDVLEELVRAHEKFPEPMHSHHDGISILREEFEELWDEIKKQVRSPKDVRKEAVQTAAMALRFILEVCDKNETSRY